MAGKSSSSKLRRSQLLKSDPRTHYRTFVFNKSKMIKTWYRYRCPLKSAQLSFHVVRMHAMNLVHEANYIINCIMMMRIPFSARGFHLDKRKPAIICFRVGALRSCEYELTSAKESFAKVTSVIGVITYFRLIINHFLSTCRSYRDKYHRWLMEKSAEGLPPRVY